MSRLRRLIVEIHKRSIWQVLAVYLLGAAAGYQIIQSLTEGLGLPAWFPSFAVVLFIVLLPVVAATALVRERPARGLEEPTLLDDAGPSVTEDQDAVPPSRPAEPRRRVLTLRAALLSLISALALWGILATGYLLVGGFSSLNVGSDTQLAALRTKLVVLPFENLGPAEDEYFADGVTEEITSRLAEIPELGVISRTTAIQYKGTQLSVRDIAQELDVEYVLEGTVRWERLSGGPSQVRVTPQLVRVADDTNIWTERYDAVLSEIFEIQTDIAENVARALDITLLEPQRQAMATAPTENLDAYDLYLRGNERYSDRFLEANALAAGELYEAATQLDSTFAVAYAALSRAQVWLHWQFGRADQLPLARVAVDRALLLAPDLADAHMALGDYHYYGQQDFGRALERYLSVQRRQPGNSDALALTAWILRRQGEWERSTTNALRAVELDPRNPVWVIGLAQNYYYMRQYAAGESYFQRAIALAPQTPYNYQWTIAFYLAWDGHMERARRTLEEGGRRIDPGELLVGPEVAWIGASVFAEEYGEAFDSLSLETAAVDSANYYLTKALVNKRLGRANRARFYYDSARVVLEGRTMQPSGQSDPQILLALAYAGLGRGADAIRVGDRAVARLPLSADALVGGERLIDLARIYVMLGDHDTAISELQLLISIPSVLSPQLLRLDPTWDPLRDNPRFQRLLEGLPGEVDSEGAPVRVAQRPWPPI